jgi:hypothetical protein
MPFVDGRPPSLIRKREKVKICLHQEYIRVAIARSMVVRSKAADALL